MNLKINYIHNPDYHRADGITRIRALVAANIVGAFA